MRSRRSIKRFRRTDDSGFSYHRYLKDLDIRKLIDTSYASDQESAHNLPPHSLCLICNQTLEASHALRLSNGAYICETCLGNVQRSHYPEVYQRRYDAFVAKSEAIRTGRDRFIGSLSSTATLRMFTSMVPYFTTLVALLSILAVLVVLFVVKQKGTWFLVAATAAIISYLLLQIVRRFIVHYQIIQSKEIARWDLAHPVPKEPELKEFHDPTTELSDRDKLILKVFDYWPGYPPFWDYIRDTVLNSDQHRCQVSGCPSRTKLHIHHVLPISKGGSHRAENLVTLCEYHHALQPHAGHQRIWAEIRTQYFSMVRAHYRSGLPVRAHVRRKELVTPATLEQLSSFYGFACTSCAHSSLSICLDMRGRNVLVSCPACRSEWQFQRKLAEETGPQIAMHVSIQQNPGRWQLDSSLMQNIQDPIYRRGIPAPLVASLSPIRPQVSSLICPRCGSPLRSETMRTGLFLECSTSPECLYSKYIDGKSGGA